MPDNDRRAVTTRQIDTLCGRFHAVDRADDGATPELMHSFPDNTRIYLFRDAGLHVVEGASPWPQ
jgi:hypothetical protein